MKNKERAVNVEKEKLEIIKWVTNLKDDSAIEKLKKLRKNPKKSDWWLEVGEEEKAAIDKGLADIKAGRVKPHSAAKKLYEKWL
jgi:hypothetical protein